MFNQRERWIGSGIMPSPGHNNHNLWLVLPQSQFGFNFSALLQLCFLAALPDGRWVMGNACILEWRLFLPGIFRILVLFLLPLGWPFMMPEVNVFLGSRRISWDQGFAPSGGLRPKHGLAEPTIEGFIPSVQPFWRRGVEKEWRWVDVSPWIWTWWESCIEFWWEFWSLPGDHAPPKCVFTDSPSSKSGFCWGQGSPCNPGILDPILELSLAFLSRILGWMRLEKCKRPLGNLFQLLTTFLILSLFLVSSWILFHFNLDFLPWGWWQWNPALGWVSGARTHPSFCCGEQLVMDINPTSGVFPWITPEVVGSPWATKLNLVPHLLGLCHSSLAEFQGKRILSVLSLPAFPALVPNSLQSRGIRFMPLGAFPLAQIWKITGK